jgi:putative transposase
MPFMLSAVKRAWTHAVPLIWNSDQGSHFTSPQYYELLLNANIQISMDGKGRTIDHIFPERLWRSVKYEGVYVHEYTSPKEAHAQLQNYFDFYNGKRLYQTLEYQTPAEVYFQKKRSTPHIEGMNARIGTGGK